MKRLIGIIIAICLVSSLVSCVKKETRVAGQGSINVNTIKE